MVPWDLHVLYPTLDTKNIVKYPSKHPPNYGKDFPKFGGNPFDVVPHILAFMKHMLKLKERHEDVVIKLYVLFLGQ